ncbi:MAG: YceI family protein [Salibacteraceae bacterium]
MKLTINTLLIAALIGACGGSNEKPSTQSETNDNAPKEKAKTVCTYSHENQTPEVLWVAYKYTEKTGVRGQFEEVSVTNTRSGKTVEEVLNGAEIKIKTASSNSGDPTRDPKIKETFFQALTNGEILSGKITSVNGDDASGKVTAMINMNGKNHESKGSYELKGDQLEMKFELNVKDWSAMDALNALNEVCEDLHKGADGKSILWPDVTVFVTTMLTKDCS